MRHLMGKYLYCIANTFTQPMIHHNAITGEYSSNYWTICRLWWLPVCKYCGYLYGFLYQTVRFCAEAWFHLHGCLAVSKKRGSQNQVFFKSAGAMAPLAPPPSRFLRPQTCQLSCIRRESHSFAWNLTLSRLSLLFSLMCQFTHAYLTHDRMN